ncbi:lipid phosphate phosphatase epsilon 2, chloroplastic [Ricinus communis]|uniref:lipid phosphate phosphatase epsilon 2, chloroplastic n=1 Tax=Ricinus communis TaxID=3988 RepID=UPI00201AFA6C|nr:lipid phosphate phosphatase epsilon 2, chloroplastic [Ricinus communis]
MFPFQMALAISTSSLFLHKMVAKRAIVCEPTFTSPLEHDYGKPTSLLHYPASKLVSFKSSIAMSKVKTSAGLVKTSAFGRGDNERSVTVFPHEALLQKPTEFPSVFPAEEFDVALNSLSKWLVLVSFVAVLLWRNDAKSLRAAMGSLVNFILCVALKKIFNQQRPISALKSDPGMPSSHAQSIFYIFVVSVLSIMERLGVNEFTLIMSLLALACSSYLCWLRVSQRFHTMSQVVVGGAVGSIFSILWCWTWDATVLDAFICCWWVRAIVMLGAATFSLGFLSHVILH